MSAQTPASPEPLVSIIIPTYNRLSYLREAVESAVGQSYKNTEIIVSDDCSPENPQAMLESFQDSRIKFYRNSKNLGNGPNAINAFLKARGKYVASLNDDDMWKPSFLEKLVPQLEANPDLSLAFCDHYIVDSDGVIDVAATDESTRQWKRDRLQEGSYQPFYEIGLVNRSICTASAAVIRRDAVEWEQLYGAGVFWDYYITYLASRSGGGAYYCPERLAQYRVHQQSETTLSGNRDPQAKIRKAKASIFCFERYIEDNQLAQFKAYFKKGWAHANTTMGIGLLRARQIKEARPYLFRALKQQKFNFRTLAALLLSYTHPSLACRF